MNMLWKAREHWVSCLQRCQQAWKNSGNKLLGINTRQKKNYLFHMAVFFVAKRRKKSPNNVGDFEYFLINYQENALFTCSIS